MYAEHANSRARREAGLLKHPAAVLTGEACRERHEVLELAPEELVVDLVVELDFRALDDGAQQAWAAVG